MKFIKKTTIYNIKREEDNQWMFLIIWYLSYISCNTILTSDLVFLNSNNLLISYKIGSRYRSNQSLFALQLAAFFFSLLYPCLFLSFSFLLFSSFFFLFSLSFLSSFAFLFTLIKDFTCKIISVCDNYWWLCLSLSLPIPFYLSSHLHVSYNMNLWFCLYMQWLHVCLHPQCVCLWVLACVSVVYSIYCRLRIGQFHSH